MQSSNRVRGASPLAAGGALLLICAFVALLISVVHVVTRDRIATAAEGEKRAAIDALLPGYDELKRWEGEAVGDSVLEIYGVFIYINDFNLAILTDSDIEDEWLPAGWCVVTSVHGFGADARVVVGFNFKGSVVGVKILSRFGAAPDEDFLGQFRGKPIHDAPFEIDVNIDSAPGNPAGLRSVVEAVNAAVGGLAETGAFLYSDWIEPYSVLPEWTEY